MEEAVRDTLRIFVLDGDPEGVRIIDRNDHVTHPRALTAARHVATRKRDCTPEVASNA